MFAAGSRGSATFSALAVAGINCVRPSAPLGDTACGSKPDSTSISARSKASGRSCACAAARTSGVKASPRSAIDCSCRLGAGPFIRVGAIRGTGSSRLDSTMPSSPVSRTEMSARAKAQAPHRAMNSSGVALRMWSLLARRRPCRRHRTCLSLLTMSCPAPLLRLARPRKASGFTLLELLVVLVVLGLLVSIVGPKYFAQLGKSESKAAQAQIASVAKALDLYRIDVGRYPTSEQGLAALSAAPANEPRWRGPYLQKIAPPDPWGRPYVYRSPGEQGAEFDLLSLGKDGVPGGTDEN